MCEERSDKLKGASEASAEMTSSW